MARAWKERERGRRYARAQGQKLKVFFLRGSCKLWQAMNGCAARAALRGRGVPHIQRGRGEPIGGTKSRWRPVPRVQRAAAWCVHGGAHDLRPGWMRGPGSLGGLPGVAAFRRGRTAARLLLDQG